MTCSYAYTTPEPFSASDAQPEAPTFDWAIVEVEGYIAMSLFISQVISFVKQDTTVQS